MLPVLSLSLSHCVSVSVCLSVCLCLSPSLCLCLCLSLSHWSRIYIQSCSWVPCSSLFSCSCPKDSAQIPSTGSTTNYSSSEQLAMVKLRYLPFQVSETGQCLACIGRWWGKERSREKQHYWRHGDSINWYLHCMRATRAFDRVTMVEIAVTIMFPWRWFVTSFILGETSILRQRRRQTQTERRQTERPSLTDIRLLTEACTKTHLPRPTRAQTHTHNTYIHTTLTYTQKHACIWSGVVGQDTGSGVSQQWRQQQAEAAIRFYCTAADSFQHTQNPHSHA